MNYTFKGRIWGYLCSECIEPLSNVKVRLYRVRKDQDVTMLAVAQPKDTFAIVNAEDQRTKNSYLIAETETDADGNYLFELGSKQKYNGEPFEVDVFCEKDLQGKALVDPATPVQFTITVLQPMWHKTQNGMVAVWDYGIPSRFWCAILARLNLWVICGKVTVCSSGIPIMGVKVWAFDTDITEDDTLGNGITDINGQFWIFYTSDKFKKTPIAGLNFEWIGGPDVYFRVESPDGTALLTEPRSKGRTPGRENSGNCLCVKLCIEKPGELEIPTMPMFTNVGLYHVDPAMNEFTPDGLTTAGNLAFTATIPLIGITPGGDDPRAIEYRFRVAEYDEFGVLGPVQNVDVNKIAPTIIGKLEYINWRPVPGVWEFKSADYWVNNPGASVSITQPAGPPLVVSLNKSVDMDGWIKVPRENSLIPGGAGRFISNGYLINLITTKLTNESYDLRIPAPGTKAGDSIPAAKKSRAHTFKLFFDAREVGFIPLLAGSNELEKIIMSNTLYAYTRHPNWAGSDVNYRTVASLDILELAGPAPGAGCGKLTNHLHALYTVYHPHLGSARVYFEGNPPLPAPLPLVIAGGESASGAAGFDFDITALPPCAYVLWLEASVNLTSGWGLISDYRIWDHIAFCKG